MLNRCRLSSLRSTHCCFQRIHPLYSFGVRNSSSGKKTHYDVLELPSTATSKEIKSAFYRLSMKHHPDRNIDKAHSADKFRDVSEAYQVLSNAETKAAYDAELNNANAPESSAHGPRRRAYAGMSVRARPPPPTGRSRIYNFDEFYRQHYGDSFRERNETRQENESNERLSRQYSAANTTLAILCLAGFALSMLHEYRMKQFPKRKEN